MKLLQFIPTPMRPVVSLPPRQNTFQQVAVPIEEEAFESTAHLTRLLDHSFIKLLMNGSPYPGPEGFSLNDLVTIHGLLPTEPANVVLTRCLHGLLIDYVRAQIKWMVQHRQSILGEVPLPELVTSLLQFTHALSLPMAINFQLWKR